MEGRLIDRSAIIGAQGNPAERFANIHSKAFAVVGVGASSGGLEAATQLLQSIGPDCEAAFILVQHLAPTHESLLVELLGERSPIPVLTAAQGVQIAPRHVYVIPPGAYLSVVGDTLHLTEPRPRNGARLPFDVLLRSLAEAYGPRAVCVVLSGTGADGSLGLAAVREKGGLVLAQDPEEAAYAGMPRSAIGTGAVDLILPVAHMSGAIARFAKGLHEFDHGADPAGLEGRGDVTKRAWTRSIVDLLRRRTAHDFTLYKGGTVQRRIERRMAIAGLSPGQEDRYLEVLTASQPELDLLAKDLLINVTRFFRDAKVFEGLRTKTLPAMLLARSTEESFRVWVVGCSTGEEAYSIAMILSDAIAESGNRIKLQIFASDVDEAAVATAREGLYPVTIVEDVSADRLERYFSREEGGYRVSAELRSLVVFTVQDILVDPPFSRIDLVSCRNLLIYLTPEAQARAIALFHFALRPGGLLLLGNAEAIGEAEDRFSIISKPDRLYRRLSRGRTSDLALPALTANSVRMFERSGPASGAERQNRFAELCRGLVMEAFAPTALLVNARDECLYFVGATERYLTIPAGAPTHDLISMIPKSLRGKMRTALSHARHEGVRQVVPGCFLRLPEGEARFSIDLRPVAMDGETLVLIGFVEEPARPAQPQPAEPDADKPIDGAARIAELEADLAATRAELEVAVYELELAREEQKAINEESLSVNEELQSTNEELLTSKEELQSVNEELTAVNNQLQESLERQKTSANDLQAILYSTDLAMLFLDRELKIRFFTPATRSLFSVIPTDIGRPLADLASMAPDVTLSEDVRSVLGGGPPIEREIETLDGVCFARRILPYRTLDQRPQGVIITFTNITERKHQAQALDAARAQAEQADAAKSRFLAVASHDLRQPLQSLALIQGLLKKTELDARAARLVVRLEQITSSMSDMLNTLLDINQIEAGVTQPSVVDFPIGPVLGRIAETFSLQALAQKLELRCVRSSCFVRTDPQLLDQMIRNIVSNALKYTRRGKVLVGCRRRGPNLAIEVWDTGVGIDAAELGSIFEEYRQLQNEARDRSRGLGLGLSIVDRLARLLGLHVRVVSHPGIGSGFIIEVPLAQAPVGTLPPSASGSSLEGESAPPRRGAILVVEDDPDVSELLEIHLRAEGHRVWRSTSGAAAVRAVAQGKIRPDLILADYNLPGGMDGLAAAAAVRSQLRRDVPVLVMTGDISITALRRIAEHDCVHVSKPVTTDDLTPLIEALLPSDAQIDAAAASDSVLDGGAVFVVDDDPVVRADLREALEEAGHAVVDFDSAEAFLMAYAQRPLSCLIIDAYLPGLSGLDLLAQLRGASDTTPAIMITGSSDTPMVVKAMKVGAWDFIEKPVGRDELIAAVAHALEESRHSASASAWRAETARKISELTTRQRQILEMVVAGSPSKNIAADLAISQRTVENHRAAIMHKLGARSLPILARMALVALQDLPTP